MDLISKKVRSEFQEFFVSKTLREISRYFDNQDVVFAILPEGTNVGGQRRTLVENYYASIDWRDVRSTSKIIRVYQDVLNDLSDNVDQWDPDGNTKWVEKLKNFLGRDGYTYQDKKISKIGTLPVFGELESASDILDRNHFQEYIERIRASINTDPSLAIGSTKELVESILKTILTKMDVGFDKNDDVPKLLKSVQRALEIVPEEIDDSAKGADLIKVLLSNLGQVVIKLTELRNLYGTGHGNDRVRRGLSPRHARLVVGAGITISTFLLDTFEFKRDK